MTGKTKFQRVLVEDTKKIEGMEGFDEFWAKYGLVCHMSSSEYPMTFEQIYNAVQNYYRQYTRETVLLHEKEDVAYGLIGLMEWGLIESKKVGDN